MEQNQLDADNGSEAEEQRYNKLHDIMPKTASPAGQPMYNSHHRHELEGSAATTQAAVECSACGRHAIQKCPNPPKTRTVQAQSRVSPAPASRHQPPPARTTDSMAVKATRRMATWIHACGRQLAEKIHGPMELVYEGTEEFTQDPNWQDHMRLEINTRLDGVSREVVYDARRDPDDVKFQKIWLTRLLLNRLGARACVETDYEKRVGRSLYVDELDERALADALASDKVKLDNATSGMRRAQWNAESKKRGNIGLQEQRKLCASVWAELRRSDAFRAALKRLRNGYPLKIVLRETLCVHNAFLGMLLARDLAVLLPTHVSQTGVDECTVVGEPAEAVLVGCTAGCNDGAFDKKGRWRFSLASKKQFFKRLRSLHESLIELLDAKLLKLVVPQGWTLDLTENACCELRRWDKARKHRTRNGSVEREKRQQKRLQQMQQIWPLLGFTERPQLDRAARHSANRSTEPRKKRANAACVAVSPGQQLVDAATTLRYKWARLKPPALNQNDGPVSGSAKQGSTQKKRANEAQACNGRKKKRTSPVDASADSSLIPIASDTSCTDRNAISLTSHVRMLN